MEHSVVVCDLFQSIDVYIMKMRRARFETRFETVTLTETNVIIFAWQRLKLTNHFSTICLDLAESEEHVSSLDLT